MTWHIFINLSGSSYYFQVQNWFTSGNYYIRIWDYGSNSGDYSDLFPIIDIGETKNIYNIYQPSVGDSWSKKEKYSIEWMWTGPITHIDIELWNYSYSGDQMIYKIADDVKNCGKFLWRVPITLKNGDYYFIKIFDKVL